MDGTISAFEWLHGIDGSNALLNLTNKYFWRRLSAHHCKFTFCRHRHAPKTREYVIPVLLCSALLVCQVIFSPQNGGGSSKDCREAKKPDFLAVKSYKHESQMHSQTQGGTARSRDEVATPKLDDQISMGRVDRSPEH